MLLALPLGGGEPPRYMKAMETIFPILIGALMLGTLTVLALGLISMYRGGDPRKSNKLMQTRVLLQGLALVLLAAFMLLFRR
jgi:hypothetical protein